MSRSRRSLYADILLLFLSLTSIFGAETKAYDYIGYGGPNGTRFFPGEKPPTTFNAKTGKGVKWRAKLPG